MSSSTAVIFLNTDGTLYDTRQSNKLPSPIAKKARQLFGEPPQGLRDFTPLQKRIAQCALFDSKAAAALNQIVKTVEKTMDVAIIITSPWRGEISIEQLKDKLQASYPLFRYVREITPGEVSFPYGDLQTNLERFKERYGILATDRGAQIECWLRDNSSRYNFKNIAILDSGDDGISKRFPAHFIHIENGLLSEKDAQRSIDALQSGNFSPFPSEELRSQV